jgi:ketosteroid isomerase-like protein
MPVDNLAAVKRVYDLLNAGDVDGVMDLCSDDVRYVNPDHAMEAGIREGKDAFRAAVSAVVLDSFDDWYVEVLELRAIDDRRVLAELHATGRGKMSGVPFEQDPGHVFQFDEEGLCVRFEWYGSREEAEAALEAAG